MHRLVFIINAVSYTWYAVWTQPVASYKRKEEWYSNKSNYILLQMKRFTQFKLFDQVKKKKKIPQGKQIKVNIWVDTCMTKKKMDRKE